MATITFRTDEFVDEALADLTSGEVDRSTAIREAILEAWQRKKDEALYQEALALKNDPADRAEAMAILAEMEALRSDAW